MCTDHSTFDDPGIAGDGRDNRVVRRERQHEFQRPRVASLITMDDGTDDLDDAEIIAFATTGQLWSWLAAHHGSHPGAWVQLPKANSTHDSITFGDLLEAGIAYGWSESTRRAYDASSYLQKFTPRRSRGTASDRNRMIADRLEAAGRMTPAGRRALGR